MLIVQFTLKLSEQNIFLNIFKIYLDSHTFRILDKYPNTYTFSKNLAEAIVAEYCEDIPTVLFRPAVGKILLI